MSVDEIVLQQVHRLLQSCALPPEIDFQVLRRECSQRRRGAPIHPNPYDESDHEKDHEGKMSRVSSLNNGGNLEK